MSLDEIRILASILGMAGSILGYYEASWAEKVEFYNDLFHFYTLTKEFNEGTPWNDFEAGLPEKTFSFSSFSDWITETYGHCDNSRVSDLIKYLLYTKQIKKDMYWNTRIYRLTKHFK